MPAPFLVRVARTEPPRFRGGAPAVYHLALDPVTDAKAIDAYLAASDGRSFLLPDPLYGGRLLCIRQGPLSAGVGARALTAQEEADLQARPDVVIRRTGGATFATGPVPFRTTSTGRVADLTSLPLIVKLAAECGLSVLVEVDGVSALIPAGYRTREEMAAYLTAAGVLPTS
jgi:hypothetical protein